LSNVSPFVEDGGGSLLKSISEAITIKLRDMTNEMIDKVLLSI